MIGKACKFPRCFTIHHNDGSYCNAHRTTVVPWKKYKTKNKFYDTKEWREARALKVASHPICQTCDRKPAMEVHHVVRLEDCSPGQEFDQDNLLSTCRSCHAKESQREGLVKKKAKKINKLNNL